MKLDRLLGITTCLLNRKTVTARYLADRYEVSVRTIQRDIAVLNTAGIPIVSLSGQSGGYGIAEGFTFSRQMATPDEFRILQLALDGIRTAWTSEPIARIQEKIATLQNNAATAATSATNTAAPSVFYDFSAFRESPSVDRLLGTLDTAIRNRRVVRFSYATDGNPARARTVKPLALQLKWHAWYLFAWCSERKGYRLFKLARIADEIRETGPFTRDHGDVGALLRQQAHADIRPLVTVRIRFRSTIRTAVREYLGVQAPVPVPIGTERCPHMFGGMVEASQKALLESAADKTEAIAPTDTTTNEVEWLEGTFTVPEGERGWMSFLIGFGADVRVLSPGKVVEQAACIARDFLEAHMQRTPQSNPDTLLSSGSDTIGADCQPRNE